MGAVPPTNHQIIQKYISIVILVLKLSVLGLGYPPFEEAPI